MTKLEENNITAQVSLMKDIINNYGGITYSVTEGGKKLREWLGSKKYNEEEKIVSFDKETFDKMLDLAYTLQDERHFGKLGILAEMAIPDNEIKIKILKQLQA